MEAEKDGTGASASSPEISIKMDQGARLTRGLRERKEEENGIEAKQSFAILEETWKSESQNRPVEEQGLGPKRGELYLISTNGLLSGRTITKQTEGAKLRNAEGLDEWRILKERKD